MSQVRGDLPSRSSDSHNGDPPGDPDPAPVPASSPDQDTNVYLTSTPNTAIAQTTSDSPTSTPVSHSQTTGVKEENTLQDPSSSHRSLMNGTASSKTKSDDNCRVTTDTVTRQPQSRVTVRTPPALKVVPLLQNGAGHVPEGHGSANGEAGNGVVCSELRSLSGSQKPHRKLQSHHSINSQISKKSKSSSKSMSSQIPTEAQEDCCVHCILSCLFCEFLTLCNIMLDCATCGSCSSEDSCICCCCCGSGECADCDLPCDMDCGIIDACCESADCLEICMECCGLCFSS